MTSRYNLSLGAIVAVDRQVVSGFNYRIYFQKGEKVTVYSQPWTETLTLLDIDLDENTS